MSDQTMAVITRWTIFMEAFMELENERKTVVRFGLKMVTSGLTTGTGGNLSVVDRNRGTVAISPSGIEYAVLQPRDVVLTDMQGRVIDGEGKPSSELGFHLSLYHRRKDVQAVVHTHSPYAVTMACLGWEIPAVHYLVGFAGKKVPLAPYATFGTPELAEIVAEYIGNYNAVLLANHGLVAVGSSMDTAFAAAEEIEFVARIYYQTKSIGHPVILSDEEMEIVLEKFKTYGQKKNG
jgi:L-fuculose-phosphate aldolase